MHPNIEKVRAALAERGCDARPVELPASTRTAPEAATAIGTTVAQIVKSLVFTAAGRPVLAIMSGSNRVSIEKLSHILGSLVERADASFVKQATGFSIGGVPPVGHAQPVRILIDRDLLAFDEVWAAAGMPNAVFPIAPQDLLRATGGEVADLREH